MLQIRGRSLCATSTNHVTFSTLSSPVSHFILLQDLYSLILSLRLLSCPWACFGVAEMPAGLANKACFHTDQAQGCAYLQRQTTSHEVKWPWKERQFREKWDTFASCAKGRAGGDSALLKKPPWKQSVATPQVLFCYPGVKSDTPDHTITYTDTPAKFLTHTERSSVWQESSSKCAVSPALNTTLLFSPGSCSCFSQGSHKSNFRACSNFWSWGDEDSTSAHSKRISWPQVMSLIALTSVFSYLITWNQKTYSNISPVILLQCVGPGTVTLWMYSLVSGLYPCQTWTAEVEMSSCKGGGWMKLLSTKQKCCGKVLP